MSLLISSNNWRTYHRKNVKFWTLTKFYLNFTTSINEEQCHKLWLLKTSLCDLNCLNCFVLLSSQVVSCKRLQIYFNQYVQRRIQFPLFVHLCKQEMFVSKTVDFVVRTNQTLLPTEYGQFPHLGCSENLLTFLALNVQKQSSIELVLVSMSKSIEPRKKKLEVNKLSCIQCLILSHDHSDVTLLFRCLLPTYSNLVPWIGPYPVYWEVPWPDSRIRSRARELLSRQ